MQAELFLSTVKRFIRERKIVIAYRPKNRNFMLEHGLTSDDIFDMINNLTGRTRHLPPENDRNGSDGTVMVFFAPYKDFEIYIKIKIIFDEEKEGGVVISFHEEGEYD